MELVSGRNFLALRTLACHSKDFIEMGMNFFLPGTFLGRRFGSFIFCVFVGGAREEASEQMTGGSVFSGN